MAQKMYWKRFKYLYHKEKIKFLFLEMKIPIYIIKALKFLLIDYCVFSL